MPQFLDVRSYITVKGEIPYHVHEADETSDPRYYGYLATNGSWVIMKQTISSGQHRYCIGKSSFSTNWTNRASLTYDYISNL